MGMMTARRGRILRLLIGPRRRRMRRMMVKVSLLDRLEQTRTRAKMLTVLGCDSCFLIEDGKDDHVEPEFL
jgi:hypothetical protein